jgi:RNA polymerase sigma factor (TIGR02999 family)
MDSSPLPTDPPVTLLLKRWRAGDHTAEDTLFAAIYDDLRRVAHGLMRNERADHTLEPTALVNEAYLRLKQGSRDYSDRTHFLAVAARVMRRFLVDHARGRARVKRGGGRQVTLDSGLVAAPGQALDILSFERVLQRLEKIDRRKAEFIQLRYFGGLSNERIAETAGVSVRTVKRDLQFARAFLSAELEADAS